MNKNESFFGIDLIKVFAIISVVSVHFLLNTEFYGTNIVGPSMTFQIFFRQLFIICVPLFLLATGFLQLEKNFNKKYLKGIGNIVLVYLIISIFVILIRIFHFDEVKTTAEWIQSFFNFSGVRYAWYVEMYIGLALIIPFLNNIWRSFKSKKEFQVLIIVMLFLTSIPSFWNLVNNGVPYISTLELPDFWTSLYPVTYYFIGVYIRKHGIDMSKFTLISSFFLLTLVQTILIYSVSKGVLFQNNIGSYNSILIVLQSTLLFGALYDIKKPKFALSKIIVVPCVSISTLTLDIYLVSYITDKFVYEYFFTNLFTYQADAILYAPFLIIVSFLLAYVISLIRKTLFPLRKKSKIV